jgi:hypothetical protein
MSKPIEEILAPKPEARLPISAYSIADAAPARILKVGQTTRDVRQRVSEQHKTAKIKTIVEFHKAEMEAGRFVDSSAKLGIGGGSRRWWWPLCPGGCLSEVRWSMAGILTLE